MTGSKRLKGLPDAMVPGFGRAAVSERRPTCRAGKSAWGPNQTLNDKDKEVGHDERLRITGVEPGRYDAKVRYQGSKQCFVRDIEIKADAVFRSSIKI
jgi:hypothetical protein